MRRIAERICLSLNIDGCVNFCYGKHLHLKQVNIEFVVDIISNLI